MDSHGYTVPEIVVTLLIVGVVGTLAFPVVQRQIDLLATVSAREEVVALVHRARMEARIHGGAQVVIGEGRDVLLFRSGGEEPLGRVPLAERGIDAQVLGPRSLVELNYGPLGVAGFAAASVVLRRRDAEARLVISGYGRVRR